MTRDDAAAALGACLATSLVGLLLGLLGLPAEAAYVPAPRASLELVRTAPPPPLPPELPTPPPVPPTPTPPALPTPRWEPPPPQDLPPLPPALRRPSPAVVDMAAPERARPSLTGVDGPPDAPPAPAASGAPPPPPDHPPRLLSRMPPRYPPDAWRQGVEGHVVLRLFVEADGTVGQVEVVASRGIPAFRRAARDAVRGWRFEPAVVSGRPTGAWCEQRVSFRMDR